MAYFEGQANGFSQLRDNVVSHLLSSGWTQVGDYLVKGRGAFKFIVNTKYLAMNAGVYNGTSIVDAYTGDAKIFNASSVMIFPINYRLYVNVNPDEVYLVVNYNIEYYQQMSFGITYQTDPMGCPWYTASCRSNPANRVNLYFGIGYGYFVNSDYSMSGGLFISDNGLYQSSSYVYAKINGIDKWVRQSDWYYPSSIGLVSGLLQSIPNQVGQAVTLLPIYAATRVDGGGIVMTCKPVHARLTRNDYILSGESVSFGHDTWDVYPFLRRNTEVRNGVSSASSYGGADHTGTIAYAVRRVE